MGIYDAIAKRRCYEPVKRNHDGWRYHRHRFEIRGGITAIEAMRREFIEQSVRPNPLLAMLRKKGKAI